MKKLLTTITAFLIFSGAAFTQDTKDTSIKKAAASICNCLEKSEISKANTEEEMQQIFLQCIFDSASSVIGDALLGTEGDMQENGEEFGEKIALELMNSGCQPFIQMSLKLAKNNLGGESDNAPAIKSAEGTITKVEEKDFLYITIKQSTGREITLLYMEYVDGSDGWIKEPAAKLTNKTADAGWTEIEIYQPKLKDFVVVKVLKKLEIK